jgi:cytochrome c oxidase cbb3-type subunit 1
MSLLLRAEGGLPAGEAVPVAQAAWHGLFWLVVANAVGMMLAALLLFPAGNRILGEWTYGRWMMVHINLELYGWTSMPLLGFLFKVYGADRGATAQWCRAVLWVWSAALGAGALSWLSGHSSGKLFLDWSGSMRIFFPGALLVLWLFLLIAFAADRDRMKKASLRATAARICGLAVLLAVPFTLYVASNPALYPAVNPDSGGPTGASQLESSLAVVVILLVLPLGITRRKAGRSRAVAFSWIVLLAESVLCAALGRADVSHHRPSQYMSLGSLLVWLPLIPAYYSAFAWHANTRRWRSAFLWWWAALVATGWILFLPGVLDHFKFTDGLVGHSFVAMAGFASSYLIFVVVQLLGEGGWIFNRARSFFSWHFGVIACVVPMTIAGWLEGSDAAFTIVPGALRNLLYALRLFAGALMFLASLDWLADATELLRQPAEAPAAIPLEKTA